MPHITVHGGPSDQQPEPVPPVEPVSGHTPEQPDVAPPEPEEQPPAATGPDLSAMTVVELRALCKAHGLPQGGSKEQLTARLEAGAP